MSIKQTVLLLFYATSLLAAQDSLLISPDQNSKSFSRLKLSGGFFSGDYFGSDKMKSFVNLNYRFTRITKNDLSFQAGIALEVGVNTFEAVFPIYIKAGPELKIIDKLFVGWSTGFIGIPFVHPILFWGINSYYLFNLTENTFFEIEGGFHNALGWNNHPLYYFNIGVSFN